MRANADDRSDKLKVAHAFETVGSVVFSVLTFAAIKSHAAYLRA